MCSNIDSNHIDYKLSTQILVMHLQEIHQRFSEFVQSFDDLDQLMRFIDYAANEYRLDTARFIGKQHVAYVVRCS